MLIETAKRFASGDERVKKLARVGARVREAMEEYILAAEGGELPEDVLFEMVEVWALLGDHHDELPQRARHGGRHAHGGCAAGGAANLPQPHHRRRARARAYKRSEPREADRGRRPSLGPLPPPPAPDRLEEAGGRSAHNPSVWARGAMASRGSSRRRGGGRAPAAPSAEGRALRVSGDLHSFVEEIGRFTRAYGFHYTVSLDPPEIRHHMGRWVVRPGPYMGVFVVETRDGARLYVGPFRLHLGDLSGAGYEEVELPSGRRVPAMKIHAEILGAVAKYAVARFMQLERAGGLAPSAAVSLESTK
jgi:hypothetical protein